MVAARVVDQAREAHREQRIPGEVEPVGDRRHRWVDEDVEDDVRDGKAQVAEPEEEPRHPCLGPVEVDAEGDRERRADPDAVIGDRLRRPRRDQEVEAGQRDAAGEEVCADPALREAAAEIHDRLFTLGNSSPAPKSQCCLRSQKAADRLRDLVGPVLLEKVRGAVE